MPALIQCVVEDLENYGLNNTSANALQTEELFALFDLDACAISNVEGSWEQIFVVNRSRPVVEGLIMDDFRDDCPSVYEVNGYMIVRGREETHPVFFVYEQTV